ncbi:hypothetical protein COCC4DRAFT_141036 [Bipolaris maydis ATCC 48331]|uniref:Uncharacterized protein n=2 Tax=Cochliobolus heterostrophus TaxID=5016 RepID=M2SNR6_COCH5|nr:uncharacterized protein COCC4DRAFT_141036 [Bipolaris maydis ATCC 48331]EMD86955.1 hypothetical protein COCHEDRAFT_1034176 [Bipolaris maydis C5]ENI04049.1 hypothetical protein COCC4DRAFT_141036 [Bipolaris maydis ATCC 48331]
MPDDSAGDAMLPHIRPLPKPHRCLFVFSCLSGDASPVGSHASNLCTRPRRWLRARLRHRQPWSQTWAPAMDAKQVRPQPTLPCLARQGPPPKSRRRFLNAEPFAARNPATSDGGPAQPLPDSAHCAALVSKRWTMAPDRWIESPGACLRPRRRRPAHY